MKFSHLTDAINWLIRHDFKQVKGYYYANEDYHAYIVVHSRRLGYNIQLHSKLDILTPEDISYG